MPWIKFILLCYALLAIFVSGGLFFKDRHYASKLLALFTLLMGLEMINYVYATTALLSISKVFVARYYFYVGFLYGPILWFYLLFLWDQKRQFNWRDSLHLIPIILAFLYFFDIFILPGEERIAFIRAHFFDRVMPLNYARALHLLIYAILIVRYCLRMPEDLSKIKRVLSSGIAAIFLFTSVLMLGFTCFARDWHDFAPYYLIISTIVFSMAYLLYFQPDFMVRLGGKYVHSGIGKADMERIRAKIEQSLQQHQLFLQRNLNLKTLAVSIDEKPHHLSQTFSRLIQESFNEHVNRYRIDYAKEILLDPAFAHLTIEAIAQEAGFNNRVTFNKFFQKFTGMKPSAYKSMGVSFGSP
ncbi:MAG: helix-turn-helix domain-containing protein [Saprospiraceae bacterium]|nr:helix-turn-helix domain-containing protein [Saprospiraceae bacterium]